MPNIPIQTTPRSKFVLLPITTNGVFGTVCNRTRNISYTLNVLVGSSRAAFWSGGENSVAASRYMSAAQISNGDSGEEIQRHTNRIDHGYSFIDMWLGTRAEAMRPLLDL